MTPIDPAGNHLLAAAEAEQALDRIIAALAGLAPEQVTAPCPLPGWTRGHVLAHVDVVGQALVRQVEAAARGRQLPFLDGGRSALEEAVNVGAGRTRAEHLTALRTLRDRHHASWPDDDDSLWVEPVEFRRGTVADVALAWWRETCVHLVDLDAGARAEEEWSPALSEHLIDFLSVRLPDGPEFVLDAPHERFSYTVAGDPDSAVQISGSLISLTTWLAGREIADLPAATHGGEPVDLPDLGPWPSALPPT
ncbi:maleylpyruvate isomerase family mycothiol-dependent enzyme [Ruania halotolerans]|uniref:maleylpyruvate isomerase family mycothiol-dependent enzyme n=1 Tax=Ruania halotolerans TaxID=2897773 RepID=UPI001E4B2462|nr:maleylpyruvate isomerase family mycothiol-dependent enzyme [Ruania halotolerans]UFU06089.1 maleylpyruvate isomerase family mycothiol-dependent enzyme [Ruania halotolerans]